MEIVRHRSHVPHNYTDRKCLEQANPHQQNEFVVSKFLDESNQSCLPRSPNKMTKIRDQWMHQSTKALPCTL